MQTQYNVFGYRIDFIFMTFTLQQKLMKMDTVTKVLTTSLGCKFLRTDPDKEDFDIFRAIYEKSTKESTKKSLVNKISTRL